MRKRPGRRQDPCGASLLGVALSLLTGVAPALASEPVAASDVTTPSVTALAITPEDHKPSVGDALTISVVATAADPSRLEYQFLLDGEVIQPWSSVASHQRVMTLDELGLHEVIVQVRDLHSQTQRAEEIYVLRRPFWPNPDMPPGLAISVSPSAQ